MGEKKLKCMICKWLQNWNLMMLLQLDEVGGSNGVYRYFWHHVLQGREEMRDKVKVIPSSKR